MDLRDTLAQNLRRKRREREKTLDEFAEEIGISRSTLQEVESGRANATLETVGTIAGNLDVPPLELLEDRRDRGAVALLETLERFGRLTPEKRARAARLFCELAELLGEGEGRP